MSRQIVQFDKYAVSGDYHWKQLRRFSLDYNPPLEARYDLVARTAQRLRGSHILDVGCGDGCLMARLRTRAAGVWGIDADPTGVSLAKVHLKPAANCHVSLASAYEIPFPSAHFDVAILADVVEHLRNPAACMLEIRRVLKDSGVLLLTTPKARADRKWDVRHEHEFAPAELEELLKPLFGAVELTFFWSLRWSRMYESKIGWRLLKIAGSLGLNPFRAHSRLDSGRFGQMLAVCRNPVPLA